MLVEMAKIFFLWFLIFSCQATLAVTGYQNIQVSVSKGKDEELCGSFDRPCHTIKHAVASRCHTEKCFIILDGEGSSVYEIEEEISIHKHIIVQGYTFILERPILTKKPGANVKHAFKIKRYGGNHTLTLTVKSITLLGIGLVDIEHGGNVTVSNSMLSSNINSSIFGGSMKGNIAINLEHCIFEKFHVIIEAASFRSMTLKIDKSQAYGESSFGNKGFLFNPIFHGIASLSINVTDSTFAHLAHVFRIRVATLQEHVTVLLNKCNFEKNGQKGIGDGAALSHIGGGEITVTECIFKGNMAVIGGALIIETADKVKITSSRFVKNLASFHGGALFLTATRVYIDTSKFFKNRAIPSGNKEISTVGIGGAISNTNGSRLELNKCYFNDNFAHLLGGTIFHNGRSLNIIKTKMYASKTLSHEGSLIYSTTYVMYDQSQFFAQWTEYTNQSQYGNAYIFHSGFNWRYPIILKSNITFHCQTGHRLESRFLSFKSKHTTLAILRCLPCDKRTYSMDRGYATWNNSQHPVKHHKIACLKCPIGGNCYHGISTIPNFWGWKTTKNEVKFIPCRSSGFCCRSEEECGTYHSCGMNRRGIFCGECKKNCAESIFSDTCMPNKKCEGKKWVVTLFVFTAVLYVLLLMYFKEIFSKLKRCLDLVVAINRKKGVLLQRTETLVHHEFLEDEDFIVILRSSSENTKSCEKFSNANAHSSEIQQPLLASYNEEMNIPKGKDEKEAAAPKDSSSSSLDSISSDSSSVFLADQCSEQENGVNKISYRNHLLRRRRKWYSYLFGVLKILSFFYQMQAIIKIPSTLEASLEFFGPRFFKEFVTGVFSLRTVGTYYVIDICVKKNFDFLEKQFARIAFILFMFFIVFFMYVIWFIMHKIRKRITNMKDKSRGNFDLRLQRCFLQMVLIGYCSVSISLCELTNCYDINGELRLYIAGQYLCNQWWYYLAYFIFCCWTVPLFFAVFCANKLLRTNYITNWEFFFTLIFPPFLVYLIARHFISERKCDGRERDMMHRKEVLLVLEEPFISHVNDNKSAWYWESVLTFRRLVLIWIYVLFVDPVTRLYAMCIPLTLFLVHHLHVKPYNSRFLNVLETSSLISLCLLVALNLFWAYNYVTNIPVASSFTIIAHVFLYAETIILVLPLVMVISAICFVFFRKLLLKVRSKKN